MIPVAQIRKASGYELLILGVTGLSAVLNLLNTQTQSKILAGAFNSSAAIVAYDAGLVIGAVLALLGAILVEKGLRSPQASPSVGLILERCGLLLSGPLLIAYGFAVWAANVQGLFAGAISAAVGAAHLLRVLRISSDLITLRALVVAANTERLT